MASRKIRSPADGVQSAAPRAFGYARVSTDMQRESGLSIDEQQVKIRARAVENGWNLDRIYVDAGVSGSVPLGRRPEGAKLLAAVKPGDVVVSARMDRCFRSAADALHTIENFKRRKISLWLLDLGNDCSGNGISELIVTILAAVAQFECTLISERGKDTKRNLRRQGKHQGGARPFGYDIAEGGKLVPNAREQKAIAEILARRRKGETLMQIRDRMRAKDFPISHQLVADLERRAAEATR